MKNSPIGTWPPRTAFLISGCLNSDPALCTLMSSLPLVAAFTSSAKCLMLTVWNVESG